MLRTVFIFRFLAFMMAAIPDDGSRNLDRPNFLP